MKLVLLLILFFGLSSVLGQHFETDEFKNRRAAIMPRYLDEELADLPIDGRPRRNSQKHAFFFG
ncbi:hypothetical protein Ciccas_005631 [Cichlidogyrus casuarinus]|uniref:Uncharacterized protein n=1 Tax=Cichlidogyrus casuarinus TaxID=1844966 RepID=A0ABD2Q854_9PLAT